MRNFEVRNGKRVWPTCSECGCRLQDLGDVLLHYVTDTYESGRDARGCKCSSLTDIFYSPQEETFGQD